MADLLELFIGQVKLQKALCFRNRIPEGIIRAESHAFCAVDIDEFLCDAVLHKHHGAGYVENAVLIMQALIGGFIHAIAAEMGRNDLQIRKVIQNPAQPCGMGVIIALVTHVEDHRKFSLQHFVSRKEPLVINGKNLRIGVHLQPPQALVHDVLHFLCDVFHARMDGTEAQKTGLHRHLTEDKIVDMIIENEGGFSAVKTAVKKNAIVIDAI